MIGRKLSHFVIEEKLGEGGMGVVYKARDEKLGRHVALKVLQPHAVGNEERQLRFLREARAAAAVTHPNIAAIYEVDEADGVVFIAMELVEGQTLGPQIEGQPLPRRSVLRYAMEIAEALARAHRANVVHRDLKPDNIIVGPDGHVKILDFGLAKLFEEAQDTASRESSHMQTISAEMTKAGRVLGTAAYMSPEQARGLPVDSRSDLFSLGIVIYEMCTGRRPFEGRTGTDTLSSILRDQPVPVTQHNPDVPPDLERVIDKCLQKEPADRYQHAEDLVVDLRRLRRATDSQPLPRASTGEVPVAGRSRWLRPVPLALGALALVALVVLATRLFPNGGLTRGLEAGVNSLAVMPLTNMKDADDPERLGQILQELIITDLSEMDSLKVYSSQRLFDIQKRLGRGQRTTIDRDIAGEVAAAAGASTMLTGSLTQIGERWTLLGQLVHVADGSVIKSERVDGEDLFAMVDDLTARLRDDLGVDGMGQMGRAVTDKTTSSLDAYQHYLAGVEALNDRHFDDAAKSLQKAVDIDPAFGAAYYQLAIAGWWLSPESSWWAENSVLEPEIALNRMFAEETKVTRKDRQLARAVRPLIEREYADALDPFAQLVEDYPDEKEAWYGLGEALFHSPGGDQARALDAFEKALELDPSFGLAYQHLFDTYRSQRRFSDGVERVRRLIDEDPEDSPLWIDWVRLVVYAGEPPIEPAIEEALSRLSRTDDRRDLLHRVAHAVGATGNRDDEVRLLEQALEVDSDLDTHELWRDLGWRAFARQEDEQAERHFEQALAVNAQENAALRGLARIYERGQRDADALRRFRGLAEADPEYLPYYGYWSRAAVLADRDDEARLALQKRLELASTASERKDAFLAASEAYSSITNLRTALDYARQAMAAAPDDEDAITNLGRILSYLRHWEEARDWFQRVVDKNPDDPEGNDGRARASLWLGETESFPTELQKMRRDFPHVTRWRPPGVEYLIVAGWQDESETLLKESLDLMPSDAGRRDLYTAAARGYACIGDYGRAEAQLKSATKYEVENARELRHQQTALYRSQGRFEDAERVVRQMLARTPNDPRTLLDLAQVHLAAGSAGAARDVAGELLDAGTHGGRAYRTMALALADLGRYAEADAFARKALEMDPRREIQTSRAWVLISGDLDVESGVELARDALDLRPPPCVDDFANMHMPLTEHALGLGYLKLGKIAEAVPLLERAAEQRPEDAAIREHLGFAKE